MIGPRRDEPGTRLIWACLATAVVGLAAVGWFSAWRSQDAAVAQARRKVQSSAQQIAAALQARLSGELANLETLASTDAVIDQDIAAMREMFHRANPVEAERGGGYSWVDRNGALRVLHAAPTDQLPFDISDRRYVREGLASDRPTVSDAFLSIDDVPVVMLTAPTRDRSGALTGLVMRALRLDEGNRFVQSLGSDDATVIDRAGAIILRAGALDRGALRTTPVRALWDRGGGNAPRRDSMAFVGEGVRGDDRVVGLAVVEAAGWTVAVDPTIDDAYGDARSQYLSTSAIIAISTLGALVTLALVRTTTLRRRRRVEDLNDRLSESSRRAHRSEQILTLVSSIESNAAVAKTLDQVAAGSLDAIVGHGDDCIASLYIDDSDHLDGSASWRLVATSEAAAGTAPAWRDVAHELAPMLPAAGSHQRPMVWRGEPGFASQFGHLASRLSTLDVKSIAHIPLDGELAATIVVAFTDEAANVDDVVASVTATAAVIDQALARGRSAGRDRSIASKLQQALLPRPAAIDERVRVAVQYRARVDDLDVGGDWYDVIPLSNHSVAIVVGDAVGRGIAAAVVMGQMRSALAGILRADAAPGAALEHLDSFSVDTPNSECTTCVVAIVDPAHETVTFASAGHLPPLLVDPHGRATLLDARPSPPINSTLRPVQRTDVEVAFPLGSTLVLYTDGLVERRDRTIDERLDELGRVVESHAGDSVADLVDCLASEMLAGLDAFDDVAVVALRLDSVHTDRFERRVGSDPAEIGVLRREIASWLRQWSDVQPETEQDIPLAITEAVTNGVEHA